MNREIKFRGKRLDNGEWVYGFYVREEGVKGDGFHSISHTIITKREPFRLYQDRVYADTVGQYTGLKDRNGVKIFEGDVVNMHQFLFDGSEHETAIAGVIKQGDYGWTLSRIKNKEVNDYMGYENGEGETYLVDFYGLHDESFEVIGNKWDNPELLEVE